MKKAVDLNKEELETYKAHEASNQQDQGLKSYTLNMAAAGQQKGAFGNFTMATGDPL